MTRLEQLEKDRDNAARRITYHIQRGNKQQEIHARLDWGYWSELIYLYKCDHKWNEEIVPPKTAKQVGETND